MKKKITNKSAPLVCKLSAKTIRIKRLKHTTPKSRQNY